MAGSERRSDADLIDRLREEPYRFDFFQAVRLLTRIADDRAPVGRDAPFGDEAVRFAQYVSLTFPASAVDRIEGLARPSTASADAGPAPPPTLTTTFFGLLGPSGVLPTIYTEELIGPQARRRGPAVEFLNLFHHRLVSLFFRAWEKYDLPSQWENGRVADDGDRAAAGADGDAFASSLFHLLGLGPESLRGRMAVGDDSLPFYTGLFAQQHRSAVMLERLLVDYFGRPFQVLSFVGRWLRLRPEERTRLGRRGSFARLGVDAVAGGKVWDVQSKFRVRVGPLSLEEFHEFLPDGPASKRLTDLVRFYDRGEMDFDVQLVLKKEDVPPCRVGSGADAARLGRSAWLKVRQFDRDAADAVLRPG
ncbi:type VI secretion system baseplate subunit TssG [Paludisphaera mucosa]|uniref:Type VI secretion system baseplate subunit TssG n=1 Tax=Paludisphaera mucosa TaxID=3030827 RepID=A0ABT6FE12_9BACT|nr:type VI secretion system baseplate subunit TssG [Paludisphaera mucosa]MDG3005789.1 type VI secretion system baseplate subunit TssG [Paludisphaera mucosa]